jgi:predicted Fe-Mo cluster-binding NifX family protein
MKIGISAMEPSLEANVDPRFGRCQYFVVVDPDTMQFEILENSSAASSGGAGISTAQMITGKEVNVVLTGNCGPNAYQVLSSAGIQVVTGVSGKVKDAVEAYKSGKLKASSQPNVPDHFGTGAGSNMGRGMGMSRGMGRGMGMGMGMRMGRGMGFGMTPPMSSAPEPQSSEQELGVLKAQSQSLAQQLSEIQRHIERLEKKDKHPGG